jgi:hypothetical protein
MIQSDEVTDFLILDIAWAVKNKLFREFIIMEEEILNPLQ